MALLLTVTIPYHKENYSQYRGALNCFISLLVITESTILHFTDYGALLIAKVYISPLYLLSSPKFSTTPL